MNTSTGSTGSPQVEKKILIVVVVAVILAIAGFFYWKNYYTPPPPKETAGTEEDTALGSELYRQATNPVEGALPESAAPAPNPLKNIYKNPFE